jgi:type IV secretion system protein VirD4
VVVIAPPGAGKGAAIIVPSLLTYQHSAVVLDPKGENYALTSDCRKNVMEHRVRRLDPFNICGEGSDTFNPLAALDPLSPTIVDDCLALADALVVKTGQEHDPHWNESAINALTGFILYITLYAPKESRTLDMVARLITDPLEFKHGVAAMQDREGVLGAKFGRSHAYESLQHFGNQLSALAVQGDSAPYSAAGQNDLP